MNQDLVKQFVDSHQRARKLLNIQKIEEAKQEYLSLVELYQDIDRSTLETFHKDLAYEQITKLYQDLNTTKKDTRLPTNLIAAALLVFALSVVVAMQPSIVGLVGYQDAITQEINLTFTETNVQQVVLKDKPLSLSVTGTVQGDAKLYLKQGEKLALIYDSQKTTTTDGQFNLVCEETCAINHDSTIIELFANLGTESTITINTLHYNIERKDNNPPTWVGETRQYTTNGNKPIELDLDNLFEDPEGDQLVYLSTSADGLDVTVNNNYLTIKAQEGITGTKDITVIASDLDGLTKIPITITIQ